MGTMHICSKRSEEEENDDVSEDLDAALRSLKAFTSKVCFICWEN
jgi:hypothetical protein